MRPVVLVLLFVPACKKVEPVPSDVDGLMRFFFVGFDPDESAMGADDERMGDALVGIDALVDAAALAEGPLDGEMTRLTDAEVASLPITPTPDPSLARGLLLQNPFLCDSATLDEVLVFAAQDQIYDWAYEGYARDFESSVDDYLAGVSDQVGWTGQIDSHTAPLPAYTYAFRTELRRVALPEGNPSAPGAAVVARTYMLSPAEFANDDAASTFSQDYQIEVYVPYAGTIVHHYAFWREMKLAGLGSMEDTIFARTNLVQSVRWDERTAEVCAAGGPDAFLAE